MKDSGRDPAPRTGRALPSWWQLVAAAIVAFLLYSVWPPVAEWAGWRSRPGTVDAGRLGGEPGTLKDKPAALEAQLFAELAKLADGDVTREEVIDHCV